MRKNGIVNKYEYVKEKITMDNKEKALLCHKEWNGKLETVAKSKVKTREDLAIAYTPGVAEPCKVIAEDKTAAYTYTWKPTRLPLFPTEAPFSALEISVLMPLCRSWKENVYYSKNLEMLTLYRSVWTPRTPKRSFRL